jgi:hypothetical protein
VPSPKRIGGVERGVCGGRWRDTVSLSLRADVKNRCRYREPDSVTVEAAKLCQALRLSALIR